MDLVKGHDVGQAFQPPPLLLFWPKVALGDIIFPTRELHMHWILHMHLSKGEIIPLSLRPIGAVQIQIQPCKARKICSPQLQCVDTEREKD